MKKGSFAGLIYREYYLGRASYITSAVSFAAAALLGMLAVLSFRYGNFNLLFPDGTDTDTGIFKNKETADIVYLMIMTGIKYMPTVVACLLSFSVTDIASKDIMTSWNRFEHCTPVTPLRYAAVKLVSSAVSTALSFVLALGYMYAVTLARGEDFTFGDLSLIVILIAFITAWGAMAQISIALLKNKDNGMLLSMVPIILFFVIVNLNNDSSSISSSDEPLDIKAIIGEITNKAQAYFPIAAAVLAAAFLLLFVSMYLLYKRREK